jgi:hypothetical protein
LSSAGLWIYGEGFGITPAILPGGGSDFVILKLEDCFGLDLEKVGYFL